MEDFTNTFSNGMTSDVNVVLQPDGTYRYMRNCQLVSQDGNNYVIKDCLGNLVTWSINAPYSGTIATVGDLPMPIGFLSFPDKLIVFSTNNNSTGGYGEIGLLQYLPYGEGVKPLAIANQYNAGYIPLYHHVSLNFSQLHRTKGFSFIENELIQRIYWTDNFNEPRVFNVSDPIYTTYIPSGSIVNGTTYMVLEGAISYNGTDYGPGITATATQNIFTGNGTTIYTNLTSTNPTPKIIEYYPYQLLDFTPSRSLGNITFDKYGSGALFCGSKVYFYRLGKNEGFVTSWSYGSSPIPVGALNESFALTVPTVPYHDFVGGGTTTALLNSTLSVFLNIENVDTAFDYLELACAEFDQLIDTPRLISIVNRVDITSSTVNIEHSGNVNLGTLTIGDITLFPASILKCKTLATNKNFILAANLTERKEFDIDLRLTGQGGTISASAFDYPMNVHREADSCSLSGMVYSGVSPVSGTNPAAASITPFSRWKVTVGHPIYDGVTYNVGDVITGTSASDTIDFATHAGSQARPCVTKNRYKNQSTNKRTENSIELQSATNTENTCFWDYKSAAAHHHVAGYWCGETYRFGILFFDKKGNPFYVKYLLDYQFPIATTKIQDGIIREDSIAGGGAVFSLIASGLNIQGITIPPDIINQISGFSIVRAERDARIITQGLVTQNIDTGASPKVYRPAASVPLTYTADGTADKVYTYLCPDSLVGVPLKKPIGLVGDTMEEASWVDPFDYGAGKVTRGSGVAGSEQIYSKFLFAANDGSIRTGVIAYYGDVLESQTLSNLGSGKHYENGTMLTSVAYPIIGACVAGTTDYNLVSGNATGCKKSVFTLENDFLNFGPSAEGFTSNDPTARDIPQRILMNYVKTGFSDPYGGTGDGAKANTLYISTGHFQPITPQVLLDTFDGNNYVFTDVEIFGGDCFTCLIDIGYALWDNGFGIAQKYSYAWTFPCECNANYNLRRGRKTSNVEMYYTGTTLTESITILGPTSEVHLEDFSYNQGYSTEGQDVVYPARPVNFVNSSQFQARIRFAGPKFAGETIDSFRTFLISDFKDLSANYGRINDVNVKEDKVVVHQDDAISTVPILERQVVSSDTGDATTIGTGGVVDRFDVITSYFGTQHQWSITETEFGFAFFDMRRKAFVILDFKGGLLEVSQVFGLKGFFDEAFLEIEGTGSSDATILVNSPTFADTSDRPLTGVGIICVWDPKFKMTYMTFKFYGQNASGTKSKDFTIGYLHTETKKCFVGFYDWFPAITHNHNQIVISVNNPKNTTQYLTTNLTNKSFVPGETIWGASSYKQKEYVCIAAVTLDNAAKFPEGVSGTLYWAPINVVNQLWVSNQPTSIILSTAPGYLYDSFFGKVVDNEVWLVINPKTPNPFSVLNIEQEGSTVNFTDIFISGDRASASDTDIKSWNRYYRIIYDKICSNLPLSSTGRITDSYLLVKMIKKNWTTTPITIAVGVKIFRWLKSFFEQKR